MPQSAQRGERRAERFQRIDRAGVISSGRPAVWAMLLWIWLVSARGRSGSVGLPWAGLGERDREPFRAEPRDPGVRIDPADLTPPGEVASGRVGRGPDSRIRISSLKGRAPAGA